MTKKINTFDDDSVQRIGDAVQRLHSQINNLDDRLARTMRNNEGKTIRTGKTVANPAGGEYPDEGCQFYVQFQDWAFIEDDGLCEPLDRRPWEAKFVVARTLDESYVAEGTDVIIFKVPGKEGHRWWMIAMDEAAGATLVRVSPLDHFHPTDEEIPAYLWKMDPQECEWKSTAEIVLISDPDPVNGTNCLTYRETQWARRRGSCMGTYVNEKGEPVAAPIYDLVGNHGLRRKVRNTILIENPQLESKNKFEEHEGPWIGSGGAGTSVIWHDSGGNCGNGSTNDAEHKGLEIAICNNWGDTQSIPPEHYYWAEWHEGSWRARTYRPAFYMAKAGATVGCQYQGSSVPITVPAPFERLLGNSQEINDVINAKNEFNLIFAQGDNVMLFEDVTVSSRNFFIFQSEVKRDALVVAGGCDGEIFLAAGTCGVSGQVRKETAFYGLENTTSFRAQFGLSEHTVTSNVQVNMVEEPVNPQESAGEKKCVLKVYAQLDTFCAFGEQDPDSPLILLQSFDFPTHDVLSDFEVEFTYEDNSSGEGTACDNPELQFNYKTKKALGCGSESDWFTASTLVPESQDALVEAVQNVDGCPGFTPVSFLVLKANCEEEATEYLNCDDCEE